MKLEKCETSLDYDYEGEKCVIQTDQREGAVRIELVRVSCTALSFKLSMNLIIFVCLLRKMQ